MHLTSLERRGDLYVARDASDQAVWTVELRLEMAGTPFREEVVWPSASVVAVGGGPTVYFLSATTGAIVEALPLDGDLFGAFGPADGDMMCVLGWRSVVAVDRSLAVRWVCREVAIDGICWLGRAGADITLSAEMDPPGGWEEVVLDAATGRVRSRGGARGR